MNGPYCPNRGPKEDQVIVGDNLGQPGAYGGIKGR